MTSFEERAANKALLASLPQIPPIPIPPIHGVAIQIASQSLSPNLLQSHPQNTTQFDSQSLSPTARDRKRLRENSTDDNKDTKRRKLCDEALAPLGSASAPASTVIMYNRPSLASLADNNDINTNCSSISRTSPSITSSSEPNQLQMQSSSSSSNDNNQEIHLALQHIATLVAKNNTNDALLSNPPLLSNLTQTNNVLSMSKNPVNNNNNNNINENKYQTLNLRIPNIDISSINCMKIGDKRNSLIHDPIAGDSSADRMNEFLFGGNKNNTHHESVSQSSSITNVVNSKNDNNHNQSQSPQQTATQLQNQLFVGMNAIQSLQLQGNLTLHDIDNELQKELNKREMRKIIAQQLEALRLQIYQQEREDEAKLEALKFMKLMQTTQNKQENKLAFNYMQGSRLMPVSAASQQQQQSFPSLPQFLQIPSFNATNLANNKQMFLEEQKQNIASNKTQSNVIPLLSGYNLKERMEAKENENKALLPLMSSSNKWNLVSNSAADEFKQLYLGHGRETIIAATGKIQPRKDMDESQCALLCNLMVELCFTERLQSKPFDACIKEDINDTLKIDPEICLKMNLNTNAARLNGFSSMIGGSSKNNDMHMIDSKKQSMFNIIPPTFQQTSISTSSSSSSHSSSANMPGLENEVMNNLSSSSDSSSCASSSSEDESVAADKFKSDSEDAPIAYNKQLILKNEIE